MDTQSKFWKIPWYLILIFVLLSTGLITIGYFYYKYQVAYITEEKQTELAAIVDLKVNQIVSWRRERMADANVILNDRFFAVKVGDWLEGAAGPDLKEEILNRLESLMFYQYQSVVLLDAQGTQRLSFPAERQEISSYTQGLARQALQTRQVVFSDLYRAKDSKAIHLSLLAPLLVTKGGEKVPVGVVLLRIDPNQFLYPLVQSWPTPSRTSEIMLLRRQGNEVVVLNELRHQKDTALTLSFQLSEPKLPAAMAARGEKGVVEGVDYRGIPVIAALARIPDSPWSLIAKIDAGELYAPLRERFQLMAILLSALIAGAGVSVAFLWRNQQARFYRQQYEVERERHSLAQRYEYLTRYANDIILLTDQDLKIVEANERAVASYGYVRDELLKLNFSELQPPEAKSLLEARLREVAEHGSLVFETVQQRQGGTTFPAEISARTVEMEGQKFYQHIIRDISERKHSEDALKESEKNLRDLASRLMTAQETERKRIAIELHDDLGQALTVFKMRLRAIERRLPSEDLGKEDCGQLFGYIDEVIENVRRLSKDLMPSTLENLGLQAALQHLLEEFCKYKEIRLAAELDDIQDLFSPEKKIVIYRIFQECLTNIAKHAQATQVSVAVKRKGEGVSFRLEDNGKGFNVPQILASDSRKRGLGLAAMEERVRMLGGSLEMWSEPGVGSRISFFVPIPGENSQYGS
jgi:PAS domain S-box-containing protein